MLSDLLLRRLNELRLNNACCDLELLSGDNKSVQIHQIVIIALNQRHFQQALNKDKPKDCSAGLKKMYFGSLTSLEVELLVEFMYGCKVTKKSKYDRLVLVLKKVDMIYLLEEAGEMTLEQDYDLPVKQEAELLPVEICVISHSKSIENRPNSLTYENGSKDKTCVNNHAADLNAQFQTSEVVPVKEEPSSPENSSFMNENSLTEAAKRTPAHVSVGHGVCKTTQTTTIDNMTAGKGSKNSSSQNIVGEMNSSEFMRGDIGIKTSVIYNTANIVNYTIENMISNRDNRLSCNTGGVIKDETEKTNGNKSANLDEPERSGTTAISENSVIDATAVLNSAPGTDTGNIVNYTIENMISNRDSRLSYNTGGVIKDESEETNGKKSANLDEPDRSGWAAISENSVIDATAVLNSASGTDTMCNTEFLEDNKVEMNSEYEITLNSDEHYDEGRNENGNPLSTGNTSVDVNCFRSVNGDMHKTIVTNSIAKITENVNYRLEPFQACTNSSQSTLRQLLSKPVEYVCSFPPPFIVPVSSRSSTTAPYIALPNVVATIPTYGLPKTSAPTYTSSVVTFSTSNSSKGLSPCLVSSVVPAPSTTQTETPRNGTVVPTVSTIHSDALTSTSQQTHSTRHQGPMPVNSAKTMTPLPAVSAKSSVSSTVAGNVPLCPNDYAVKSNRVTNRVKLLKRKPLFKKSKMLVNSSSKTDIIVASRHCESDQTKDFKCSLQKSPETGLQMPPETDHQKLAKSNHQEFENSSRQKVLMCSRRKSPVFEKDDGTESSDLHGTEVLVECAAAFHRIHETPAIKQEPDKSCVDHSSMGNQNEKIRSEESKQSFNTDVNEWIERNQGVEQSENDMPIQSESHKCNIPQSEILTLSFEESEEVKRKTQMKKHKSSSNIYIDILEKNNETGNVKKCSISGGNSMATAKERMPVSPKHGPLRMETAVNSVEVGRIESIEKSSRISAFNIVSSSKNRKESSNVSLSVVTSPCNKKHPAAITVNFKNSKNKDNISVTGDNSFEGSLLSATNCVNTVSAEHLISADPGKDNDPVTNNLCVSHSAIHINTASMENERLVNRENSVPVDTDEVSINHSFNDFITPAQAASKPCIIPSTEICTLSPDYIRAAKRKRADLNEAVNTKIFKAKVVENSVSCLMQKHSDKRKSSNNSQALDEIGVELKEGSARSSPSKEIELLKSKDVVNEKKAPQIGILRGDTDKDKERNKDRESLSVAKEPEIVISDQISYPIEDHLPEIKKELGDSEESNKNRKQVNNGKQSISAAFIIEKQAMLDMYTCETNSTYRHKSQTENDKNDEVDKTDGSGTDLTEINNIIQQTEVSHPSAVQTLQSGSITCTNTSSPNTNAGGSQMSVRNTCKILPKFQVTVLRFPLALQVDRRSVNNVRIFPANKPIVACVLNPDYTENVDETNKVNAEKRKRHKSLFLEKDKQNKRMKKSNSLDQLLPKRNGQKKKAKNVCVIPRKRPRKCRAKIEREKLVNMEQKDDMCVDGSDTDIDIPLSQLKGKIESARLSNCNMVKTPLSRYRTGEFEAELRKSYLETETNDELGESELETSKFDDKKCEKSVEIHMEKNMNSGKDERYTFSTNTNENVAQGHVTDTENLNESDSSLVATNKESEYEEKDMFKTVEENDILDINVCSQDIGRECISKETDSTKQEYVVDLTMTEHQAGTFSLGIPGVIQEKSTRKVSISESTPELKKVLMTPVKSSYFENSNNLSASVFCRNCKRSNKNISFDIRRRLCSTCLQAVMVNGKLIYIVRNIYEHIPADTDKGVNEKVLKKRTGSLKKRTFLSTNVQRKLACIIPKVSNVMGHSDSSLGQISGESPHSAASNSMSGPTNSNNVQSLLPNKLQGTDAVQSNNNSVTHSEVPTKVVSECDKVTLNVQSNFGIGLSGASTSTMSWHEQFTPSSDTVSKTSGTLVPVDPSDRSTLPSESVITPSELLSSVMSSVAVSSPVLPSFISSDARFSTRTSDVTSYSTVMTPLLTSVPIPTIMIYKSSQYETEEARSSAACGKVEGYPASAACGKVEGYPASGVVEYLATGASLVNTSIMSNRCIVEDTLVLTKPLGTLVAMTAYNWLDQQEKMYKLQANSSLRKQDIRSMHQHAQAVMARSNKTVAKVMESYDCHSVIQVSNEGLLGSARSLVAKQENEVSFLIHNLPLISKTLAVSDASGEMFELRKGECPENSGGLLIALPKVQVVHFIRHIKKQDGHKAWVIGRVIEGKRTVELSMPTRIIEVHQE